MIEILEINVQRIEYLQKLFGLNCEDFLEIVNKGLKKPLTKECIFNEQIKSSHLKRVDKIFGKGLSFYTDSANLPQDKSSSIFFRKNDFNSKLEFGDRELVHKMECRISSLSALSTLSNYKIKRKIKECSLNDKPRKIAEQIRKHLLPKQKIKNDRDFLKELIGRASEHDILVLEFVEAWNKKDKTNLNGFFIAPHYIVVKRQQGSLKREIFTLAHELGHYLLNKEEIDNVKFDVSMLNEVEKWCDEFAFAFLSGDTELNAIKSVKSIDDSELKRLSQSLHVSRLALFTHLFVNKRISSRRYSQLKNQLEFEYKSIKEEREQKKKRNESSGIKQQGRTPKPIFSPLEKDIYASAYFEGVCDEYRVLSHFKTKSLDSILYG